MQVSEQLRRALRAFHFRRLELQIRHELVDQLNCSAGLISFVEWEEHDRVLQQYSLLRQATETGRYPQVSREWRKSNRAMLEKALALQAIRGIDWTGYLYIPRYLVGYTPYRGYKTVEVPLVRVGRFDEVFLRATRLLDFPGCLGYFECILSDLANAVCFDLSEVVDYQQEPVPMRLEVYSVTGLGFLAVDWVSHL
jgi:hypothetical protein